MGYIQKNRNRDEEKVFSVTMTEEELKLFSEYLEQKEFESRQEVWEREKKEEIERNKERDRLAKKLPKEDLEHAARMWRDTDSAGRIAMRSLDRDFGLIGGGAGYFIAKAGKKAARKAGKSVKRGGLITSAAVLGGSAIARRAGFKRSERVAQDIWNEGDRRQMEFIKADKKTREELKKNYEPISPLWRKIDEEKKD